MKMRLQKFMALSGLASRRKAENLIRAGRIFVNGVVARLGTVVEPTKDKVDFEGRRILAKEQYQYIMLNKPIGYVSTKARFANEHSVYDLVPDSAGLSLAGRLDKETSGLLLMTNDGGLIQRLTHPSFRHEKEYIVLCERPLSRDDERRLLRGVSLEEGRTALDALVHEKRNQYRVIIHQGWKRQIRRMFSELGVEIVSLQRIRIGALRLGHLPSGRYKKIRRRDIL